MGLLYLKLFKTIVAKGIGITIVAALYNALYNKGSE